MNNLGIQLRISDLLFALKKRWKIIIFLTFIGLVFGLMLSGLSYVQSAADTYQVNGSFIIAAVNTKGIYSSNSSTPSRNDFTMASDLYDTIYYLMRSDRLMLKIINDRQMLGVSASDIRDGMTLSRYNETTIIKFGLSWANFDEAEQLWRAILDTTNELLPEIVEVGQLRIVNDPVTTTVSAKKASAKTYMILPVLGLVAGIGYSVVELLMRPTLINVKDVETVFGLETMGIIPYDPEFFSGKQSILVKDEKSASEVDQNYSAAAYILRNRLGNKGGCHCFYVTSTNGKEGRTTAAANIAIQLSDMEKKTLLIDFDYKNPMLGSLFLSEVDYNRSLNALYQGEVTIADAITPMTGYLDILPMVMEHNLIYLDSTLVDLITSLKETYEYIIIDAPPVGKESETLSLNQVANTVLFVARYDEAPIPEIQAALQKLDKSGIRILGCIVNAVRSTKSVMFGDDLLSSRKNTEAAASKKKKSTKKKPAKASQKAAETKETDSTLSALIGQKAGDAQPAPDAETQPDTPSAENDAFLALPAGKQEKKTPPASAKKTKEKKPGLFSRKPAEPKKKAAKAESASKASSSKKKKQDSEKGFSLFGKPKPAGKGAKKDPFDKIMEDAVVVSKPRDVFEDLMDDDTPATAQTQKSDAEIMEALVQMGLDGSWDGEAAAPNQEEAKQEAPAKKKRNIFEDL